MELNNDQSIVADAEGNVDLAIVESSEHGINNNNNNNQRMPLEAVDFSIKKRNMPMNYCSSELIKLEKKEAVILDPATFNKVTNKRHKEDYLQHFFSS